MASSPSSNLSHGSTCSLTPPVPQPPPSRGDRDDREEDREDRREERHQKEVDEGLEGEAHWEALHKELSIVGGRMYSYKPLDGTVALEAADLVGLRGDHHKFRALYKRYLDWLKLEGKALTRENCSSKAFKGWVDLDMDEADSKAVAATPREKVIGFPKWFLEMMPDVEEHRSNFDEKSLCKVISNFILVHNMLADAVASYGAVLSGEMLRRFYGDSEAIRLVAAAVSHFDERQRKDYETYGSHMEPDKGLEGCLFSDWKSRYGLTHRPINPDWAKSRDMANKALEIIRGWPARKGINC